MNLEVNANDVSVVITKGGQRFLTHCLARSAAAFEIVCSDFILQLAERLLGASFRLIAKRIYSTPPNFHMQWHTDADLRQTPRGDCPALTFILYLTDVVDGEFELIKKSDRWDPQQLGLNDGVEISDEFVEKNFAEQVRRFPMNRGGMIIYNARVVHRATPMRTVSSPHRKSLYFQINRGQACGEPILVNTEFLHMLDARRQMLLGFSGRLNAPSFPSPPKTL